MHLPVRALLLLAALVSAALAPLASRAFPNPVTPHRACAVVRPGKIVIPPLPPRPRPKPPRVVSPAPNPNKAAALKPNLILDVVRRSFTPDEHMQLVVAAFNAPSVRIAAYPVDLGELIAAAGSSDDGGNSGSTHDLDTAVAALPLQTRQPAAAWRYSVQSPYPDQWSYDNVKAPKLAPGAYVIVAASNSHGVKVQSRVWATVSGVALLAKRSPGEVLIYAADAESGRPAPNVAVRFRDNSGPFGAPRATGPDGLLRAKSDGASGLLWVYGSTATGPVFAAASAPIRPEPYAVYTVTDRPVYRPGNLVQYKATLRRRVENPDAAGGFDWKPCVGQKATVEIRDAGNALIQQKQITTDANGAVSGALQLADEPSLGDWRLTVAPDKDHSYGSSFSVEAYRKPEMTVKVNFDHSHTLGGSPIPATIDAQYLFGRPVSHARVRYSVAFNSNSYNGIAVESDYNAAGVTDEQGHLQISIPTRHVAADRTVNVSATVTDLSRRSEQGQAFATVAAGLYRLSLDSDKSVYRPGEPIVMTAAAADYDGKPVAGAKVRLQMIEHKEDDKHRPYDETTTRDAVTDKDGHASASFSTPRVGQINFHAESYDSQQDRIVADDSVEVTSDQGILDQNNYIPPIALSFDQASYNPGDRAKLTIESRLTDAPAQPATAVSARIPPRREAWALVTLEGESLGVSEVVHLTRRKTTIPIPLALRDAPSITVHAAILQDRQLYESGATANVDLADKQLSIFVAADKADYQPGDKATYTITTKNTHGTGVPADLSLGVVDAGIYEIRSDNAEDLFSTFYGGQQQRVTSDYSFAVRVQPYRVYKAVHILGANQNETSFVVDGVPATAAPMPALAEDRAGYAADTGGAMPGIRVRSAFADTAYWNAAVETGPDGTAQLHFDMPDNLTTWRATARGITLDTRVGSGSQATVSAMPLLVRLEMPRFAVAGDHTVISAIVQNGTKIDRAVKVAMQPTGATLDKTAPAGAALTRTLDLPPGAAQRCDWPMIIAPDAQQATFSVTADGGPGGQDAAEGKLPVHPDGVQSVIASAFTLTSADSFATIDLTKLPPGSSLALTLAPSLASGVADAVDNLAEQPSGDAEETASALLANVAAARALRDAGHSSLTLGGVDLDAAVSAALQKLYRYQHPDGGWNWWEFDLTDGDMTASVLSALVRTRDAGYVVDPDRLQRGANELRDLIKADQDLTSRADWLLTLSEIAPGDARAPLVSLFADRGKLGTYAEASLALGLANVGRADSLGNTASLDAQTLARELWAQATAEGRSVSWPLLPGDAGCLWAGDDVTISAHVLCALLTVTPDDPRVPAAVRWLMAQRRGASWDSTRATAEAVLALSQFIEQTHDLAPDYTARVALDSRTLAILTAVPRGNLAPLTVALTPGQLAGKKKLTIARAYSSSASGTLYISQVTTYLTPPIAAVPQMHGIAVKRQFRLAVDDPSQSGALPSGSGLDVVLDIDADTDYRYVKVVDRIPAGCEVTNGDTDDNNLGNNNGGWPIDYSDGPVGYARQQVRDDRVEFTFDSLPKGHTQLTYHLSGETPGAYRILSADAALAYQPEVRGSTTLATVAIGE